MRAALIAILCFAAGQALSQPVDEKPVFVGAKTEWHKVTGQDGTFTVEAPPGRAFTSKSLRDSAKNAPVTTRTYRVVAVPFYYEVHSTIYPPEVDCSNPTEFLRKVLNEKVLRMDGKKWTSVTWVKHQGLTAFDAFGIYGFSAARVYTVIRGQQIIAIHYYGPDGTGRDEAVNRLIGSLNIR